MRAEEDFLRHAVAELDQLDPQPGEEVALEPLSIEGVMTFQVLPLAD
jgi:DNA repair ATPase RecN